MMQKVGSTCIIVLVLFWRAVSSSQQHLICDSVPDIFARSGSSEIEPRYVGYQGPPGKMGPVGARGQRGLPGKVSYDKINDTIDERVTKLMDGFLQSTIAELNDSLAVLISEWDDMKPLLDILHKKSSASGCPGFVYENNCFYVIVDGTAGLAVDYFAAKSLCRTARLSGKLGNIYSEAHYRIILRNVMDRKGETTLNFINFWTAMKREIPSGRVLLSDGSPATYVGNARSSTEWQTSDSRRKYVYVSVWTDGESHDDNPGGYGNVWPTFRWNAALCQYPVIAQG